MGIVLKSQNNKAEKVKIIYREIGSINLNLVLKYNFF